MRKLEKFKNVKLPINQQLNTIGGLRVASRTLCTSDTCVENCSDTSATWTRDDNFGNIISETTEIVMSTNDCP